MNLRPSGLGGVLAVVLLMLGHGYAVADLVSRNHRELVLQFDLTGRQNSAVQFDFDALIAGSPEGFHLVSNDLSGSSVPDGFKLVNPVARSNASGSGPNVLDIVGGPQGFYRENAGEVFQTAMFNVAAYDGQMIALRVGYDTPARSWRGNGINIANISVQVDGTGPGGLTAESQLAVVPEPGAVALIVLGLAGLGFSRRTPHSSPKGG